MVSKRQSDGNNSVDNGACENYSFHKLRQNFVQLRPQKCQTCWLIQDLKLKESVAYNSYLNDWHPADIKAALAKKGISLSSLARENGYAITSPSNVFRKPWPAMERIMANAIGVSPQDIWPSRYDYHGTPHRTVRLARVKRSRNG